MSNETKHKCQEEMRPVKLLCPNPRVIKLKACNYADPSEFKPSHLTNHTTGLNHTGINKFFLQTFRWKKEDKCCQVLQARLRVKVKALSNGRTNTSPDAGNDNIAIVKNGGHVIGGHSRRAFSSPPFNAGHTEWQTFVLTGSDLDWLNSSGKLSFLVQDDTSVLVAYLVLKVCCLGKRSNPNPKPIPSKE